MIVGAGYVGSAFGKRMKEKGHHITVASRTVDKIPSYSWADKVILWEKKIPENIDSVLLAAAPRNHDYRSTYLDNALVLSHAPHIVYTSSTSVYGEHHGKRVDEDSLLNPMNENNEILIETEEALPKEKSCIFRLGEIVGPGRDPADRLFEGARFPGTGESFCNFSPLTLILEKLEWATVNKKTGLYNLVSPEHPTRKEFFDKIAKEKGITYTWDPLIQSPHRGNKIVTSKYFK